MNIALSEAMTLTISAEAPGLLEEGRFDVVFLDLHMPPPDGIELTRQMRADEAHCGHGFGSPHSGWKSNGDHFDRLALTESERLQEFLLPLVLEETARSSAIVR